MEQQDTIFALSSGQGKAGVAVIRVSGSRSRFVLETITGRAVKARAMMVADLRSRSGAVIDQAVTLFFAGPHSFTGDDVVEFQLHGGRAVVASMLKELASFDRCRVAAPGEFTRRAVLNGRIDLLRAEAIADLIDAETEAQRRLAILGQSGQLSNELNALRSSLLDALGEIEAGIDFSDEGDVTAALNALTRPVLEQVKRRLVAIERASVRAERVRSGLKIVLAGAVNSGKSTLLNTLAKRDVAIVSPIAGTTRDRLEVHLDLDGWPVTVIDTAGIRPTEDEIEAFGIDRAWAAIASADLVLHLSKTDVWDDFGVVTGACLKLRTQIDSKPVQSREPGICYISAKTGDGLDGLVDRITALASGMLDVGNEPVVQNERQLLAIRGALANIDRVLTAELMPELIAEELRSSAGYLANVIGPIDSEAILGQIFARFCIGK